ncbi:thiopeptide-type bacteriocin biosynthesis protein [Saccharothrix syringae]|nr:thiopeptide-type bacteriocin biosynthesis protein [Saccharothrix syringae]
MVDAWWYMRKHLCWRLRLRPGPAGHALKQHLADALDTRGRISAWWPGVYEAETAAFGGPAGMNAAHDLFCADSRAILNLTHTKDLELGRRELSLLLCTTLLRAASLEWYEQGDVWQHVTRERPLPADVPTTKTSAMAVDLTRLLRADTSPEGPLLGTDGPLSTTAPWMNAFRKAGHSLGTAAREGTLHRGLREVLSYLVIFHWNRLGLPTRTQSILAHAAHTAVLNPPATAPHENPTQVQRLNWCWRGGVGPVTFLDRRGMSGG